MVKKRAKYQRSKHGAGFGRNEDNKMIDYEEQLEMTSSDGSVGRNMTQESESRGDISK